MKTEGREGSRVCGSPARRQRAHTWRWRACTGPWRSRASASSPGRCCTAGCSGTGWGWRRSSPCWSTRPGGRRPGTPATCTVRQTARCHHSQSARVLAAKCLVKWHFCLFLVETHGYASHLNIGWDHKWARVTVGLQTGFLVSNTFDASIFTVEQFRAVIFLNHETPTCGQGRALEAHWRALGLSLFPPTCSCLSFAIQPTRIKSPRCRAVKISCDKGDVRRLHPGVRLCCF